MLESSGEPTCSVGHKSPMAPIANLGCAFPFVGSLFLDPHFPGIPCLEEFPSSFLGNPALASLFEKRLFPKEFPSLGNSLYVPVRVCVGVGTGDNDLPKPKKYAEYIFKYFKTQCQQSKAGPFITKKRM